MDHTNHLAMSHDPTLVVISWVVAFFAAFSALHTLDRLRESPEHRGVWLFGGALSFGFGVWAMHFTAMTAMSVGRFVTYDPALTALSVVFAVLGAWASFGLITAGRPNLLRTLACGTLLGAGIGAMHYVGMMAMRLQATLSFDLTMVGVSVLVAVTISSLGLWLITAKWLEAVRGRTFIVAAVVGSAIPLLHYAGMAAARFQAVGESTGVNLAAEGAALSLNLFLVVAIVALSLPLFFSSLFQTTDEPVAEAQRG